MTGLAGRAEVEAPPAVAPPFDQAVANTTSQSVPAEDPVPPCPPALTRRLCLPRNHARYRDAGFTIRTKRDAPDRPCPFLALFGIQITGAIVGVNTRLKEDLGSKVVPQTGKNALIQHHVRG